MKRRLTWSLSLFTNIVGMCYWLLVFFFLFVFNVWCVCKRERSHVNQLKNETRARERKRMKERNRWQFFFYGFAFCLQLTYIENTDCSANYLSSTIDINNSMERRIFILRQWFVHHSFSTIRYQLIKVIQHYHRSRLNLANLLSVNHFIQQRIFLPIHLHIEILMWNNILIFITKKVWVQR